MKLKVVVSDRVRKYLAAETNYLRKHSSTAHRHLVQRMREAARLLSEYPLAGTDKVVPVPGLRRLVVDDYVLDYEVADDEVHILSMRHGRQHDPLQDPDDDFDYEA